MLKSLRIELLFVALALFLDNFLFRSHENVSLHPIRFILIVAIVICVTNFKKLELKSWLMKSLLALACWALAIALVRFFLYYSELNMAFSPILRHFAAFSLGIVVFKCFQILRDKYSFEQISTYIVACSIFPLALGFFEKASGQMIGKFPRIDSFFSEPAHFGDYLILLVAPLLIGQLSRWSRLPKALKLAYTSLAAGLILCILFLQSGTALLKFGTLVFLFVCFYPLKKRFKFSIAATALMIIVYVTFFKQGYVNAILGYAIKIYNDPSLFFHPMHYTIFDRFYSIYSATTNLFSLRGVIGLGFGGDYYEFKNLFPESVQGDLVWIKPTFSYFNSFTSKVFLYFGVAGVTWFIFLLIRSFKCRNVILKIALLNVLIASLWGLGNFSLPYVWFWLSMGLEARNDLVEQAA